MSNPGRRLAVCVLLLLPLLAGCAGGLGNFGPGADDLMRVGRRARTISDEEAGSAAGEGRYWEQSWMQWTHWHGSFTAGAMIEGYRTTQFTGTPDTTKTLGLFYHADLIANLPGDAWGLGLSGGYMSSKREFSPYEFTYHGPAVGLTLFRRLGTYANIDGSAWRVYGTVADDIHYFPSLPKEPKLPAWRYEADLNLLPSRTLLKDFGIRLGYQWTQSETRDVYGIPRRFRNEGPTAELLILHF